jgi:hypothetical protein
MALDAGERHGGRQDLMVYAPVHGRFDPLVFTAIRQAHGLHTVGKSLLPVTMLPIGGLVLFILGKKMGTRMVAFLASAAWWRNKPSSG